MKSILFNFIFLAIYSLHSSAQTLNRSVINYAGGSYNPMFTFNAGEAIVGSQVFSFYADKGFIQPMLREFLNDVSEKTFMSPEQCYLSSPVTNFIKWPEDAFDISVYNNLGVMVYESNISPREMYADNFQSGLFIAVYHLQNKTYRCKFIVVK